MTTSREIPLPETEPHAIDARARPALHCASCICGRGAARPVKPREQLTVRQPDLVLASHPRAVDERVPGLGLVLERLDEVRAPVRGHVARRARDRRRHGRSDDRVGHVRVRLVERVRHARVRHRRLVHVARVGVVRVRVQVRVPVRVVPVRHVRRRRVRVRERRRG